MYEDEGKRDTTDEMPMTWRQWRRKHARGHFAARRAGTNRLYSFTLYDGPP